MLYAACHCNEFRGQRGGAVVAYDIDLPRSRLLERNYVLLPNPHPTHISLDESGKWLLAASSAGGAITVIGIDKGGALGAIATIITPDGLPLIPSGTESKPPFYPGTRLPSGKTAKTIYPHCVALHPNNHTALACDLFQSKIYRYRFDQQTGALEDEQVLTQQAPTSGARLLALHPNGSVFYSVNEYGLSVSVYQLDDASMREVQCISLLPDNAQNRDRWTASGIALHPSGRALYASIRGLNEIVHLSVDTAGMVQRHERTPCYGDFPRTICLSPDARFLYCANTHSGCIAAFHIAPRSLRLTTPYVVSAPGATHLEFLRS
jgi:6-phosphogluconolactonase